MEILSKKYQKIFIIRDLFKNFWKGNILSKRFKASRQLDLGLVKKEKTDGIQAFFWDLCSEKGLCLLGLACMDQQILSK